MTFRNAGQAHAGLVGFLLAGYSQGQINLRDVAPGAFLQACNGAAMRAHNGADQRQALEQAVEVGGADGAGCCRVAHGRRRVR